MKTSPMGKRDMIRSTAQNGERFLDEVASKQLIRQSGIETVETRLARTKKEAVSMAREIGFPVALKVISADIIHKSDSGGVRLGINSATEMGRAYGEVLVSVQSRVPDAAIEGVAVQQMLPPGIEVIMGMSKDPQFGPVLMFGLGGIFVEVLKDVSFRIVPIERRDARQMIEEIKGFPVLQGYRGQESASLTALEDALLKLSSFIENKPEIKELDLNPMIAYSDRVVAVDARVILESQIE